jgi:hypothetical protein|tara:strand:+ start:3767 stop:4156 length:390 start_codon:yes stop_codon:yes gene_type:complete
MSEQTFTLSNFRAAPTEIIEDWPLGSNKRGPATFTHETNGKKGQRIGRQTPYKGRLSKPKYSTYYIRVCLVDGSDGKTHYIGWSEYGFLSVMSCDMKHSDFGVFDQDEHFAEYKTALFEATEVEEPQLA